MTRAGPPRALTLMATMAFVTLAACAGGGRGPDGVPETSAFRDEGENRVGREAHPKILDRYGGAYDNPRLAAYVDGIGERIAAVSEQPDAPWTFTVLDTETVNAFALPGGYVYVTRGLVALADDEAELAGVIGHEIGHVTAGHSSLRQDRSTVAGLGLLLGGIGAAVLGIDPSLVTGIGQAAAGGILASYSRDDELAADALGVRYIARAGYDPYAQAEFMDSLGRNGVLEARLAGVPYSRDTVGFFASHPATADRTREAIRAAEAAGDIALAGTERNRDRFLDAIDGMIWGQSPEQGFVRGRDFVHTVLRIGLSVPQGFSIANRSDAVVASGPDRSRIILEGGEDPGGPLDAYIRNRWLPALGRSAQTGTPRGLGTRWLNGLEAAEAVVPLLVDGTRIDAYLLAVRHGGRVYRLTGLVPGGSPALAAVQEGARSFRRLTDAEVARYGPQRIEIATVRDGDTVAELAARMDVPILAEERFRVLNGIGPAERPRPGDRVKLIVEK